VLVTEVVIVVVRDDVAEVVAELVWLLVPVDVCEDVGLVDGDVVGDNVPVLV
jgi:hypothetical protein